MSRITYVSFLGLISPLHARAQGQYQFVYETLLEYTRGIDSRFPVNVLAEKIKERGIKDKKTKKNAYQMEFLVRATEGGLDTPLCTVDCNGVGSEAIERLRFLASLPLAGTGRSEAGEKTQPFNRFQSRLGTYRIAAQDWTLFLWNRKPR